MSALCLLGDSLQIQQASIRQFPGPCTLSKCVDTATPATAQPEADRLLLSQQPNFNGQIQGVGYVPLSPVDFASLQVGVCNQLKEEQPWRADGVLGSRARLMQSPGHSVGNQMNSFEQAVQWLQLQH